MFQEIPIEVRLKYFLQEWKLITQDIWVLSVLKEGPKLEYIQKLKFQGVKKTSVYHVQSKVLLKEVKKLLEKEAIETVLFHQSLTGFTCSLK